MSLAFLIKLSAVVAALLILRAWAMKWRDWQHLAIDAGFALAAFWGYMELVQAAAGIGFRHSPLQGWADAGAEAIGARAFIADHKFILPVAYVLWTTYFNYWSHRIFHKVRALWELHKVHHSATRMTGLSVYRVHPLEEFVSSYFAPLMIALLLPETGPRFAIYWGLFIFVHNMLIHSEWRATWGMASLVFTSPAAHQVHHSTNQKHFDSNFGSPLSIWDRLHGTYVDPLKTEAPTSYGVDGFSSTSLRALLVDPFVRFGLAVVSPKFQGVAPALLRIFQYRKSHK